MDRNQKQEKIIEKAKNMKGKIKKGLKLKLIKAEKITPEVFDRISRE